MSFFSGKKETIVGTSVTRVIKDSLLPNSAKTGLTKALLGKSGNSIPDHMLEEYISSIAVRADRMYEYGASTYTHGLPSGQTRAASQGRSLVQTVLNTLEGATVDLEYCNYGAPNNLHLGWMKLIADYGYDPDTNQLPTLSAIKGTPVYLDDMVVIVPLADVDKYLPGVLAQWGTPARAGTTPNRPTTVGTYGSLRPHSPVFADPAATDESVKVTYVWLEEVEHIIDGRAVMIMEQVSANVVIPLSGLVDETAGYFHAKYVVGGETKYFMYQSGLGTYPTLDAVFDVAPVGGGTFFPFAYYRYNGASEIADTGTPAYQTSKRLVKYLGMDYDAIAASIDENPDIDDVEQAMMVMAVPANTENPLERRYLYDFFLELYMSRTLQYGTPMRANIYMMQNEDPNAFRHSIVIQDSRFKMVLSDLGIYKRRVAGSIGAIGSYTSGRTTSTETYQYEDLVTGIPGIGSYQVHSHYYRRQVSHALYDEIVVVGMRMQYYVLDGYYTTADEDDNILMIPLDRAIASSYTITDREVLYARSLHFVFNSAQVIKVAWYQSDFFQFVMIIAAVAIAVVTNGTGIEKLINAIAIGGATMTTAIITLATNLLIGLAVAAGVKLFVKAVGGEFALALAVVLAVAGLVNTLTPGGIPGIPFADMFLQMASSLTNGINAFYTDAMASLAGEYQSFLAMTKDAQLALENANKLLENTNYLNPITIFGESPDEFYNRTVHSGNIGVLSIGAISAYVDNALELPKLINTLGDSAYV